MANLLLLGGLIFIYALKCLESQKVGIGFIIVEHLMKNEEKKCGKKSFCYDVTNVTGIVEKTCDV